MVSLRNGRTVKTNNDETARTLEPNPFPRSQKAKEQKSPFIKGKKRKARDPTPAEAEDKKEMNLPSTPKGQGPQLSAEPKAEPEQVERTPGRLGPIKPEDFSVEPDIKPFKGPPGKKVRKTAHEKNEEYTQFIRENESHPFHELHVCFDKGPNGSPTYDKSGFELDYDKVAEWMRPKPYNKGAMVRSMDRAVDKRTRDSRSMAEIFFEKGEAPPEIEHTRGKGHWKDRVSKDLNIPWHKIGVKQFEEWEKKGFKKARKGEYENFSKSEEERITRLLSGASLRK